MILNFAALNWLDYLLLILAVGMVIEGLTRGLTRVAISLAGLVLGLLAGVWFYAPVAALYRQFVATQAIANLLGFFTLFIGFQIAGAVLGWVLSKMLKSVGMTWPDRVLGGVFGLAKSALLAIGVILILTAFPARPFPHAVAQSQIAPYVIDMSRMLASVAPREMKDAFAESYDRIIKLWSDVTHKEPPQANI
jgi:membrane protein required for colicin V production